MTVNTNVEFNYYSTYGSNDKATASPSKSCNTVFFI